MTKLEMTKRAAKIVVGTSVSFTIANVLRNNVSPAKPSQTAQVWIGSIVVGVMVAEKAEIWIDNKIDELIESYNESKNEN